MHGARSTCPFRGAVLPNVRSHGLGIEPPLLPDPQGIEAAAIDNALDGSLRDVQVVSHLLWGPTALRRVFSFLKSLAKRLDLVLEVSGALL